MNRVETYRPTERQNIFHGSPAKYRLFGGAAGPGKSTALLWEGVLQVIEHKEPVSALLLRRTFAELESSLLTYFRRDVPWRQMGAQYNESKHICTWPNGGTLRFGYCASETDVYQYQGAEFLFIGIDELTMFTLKMWQFLTSRNRCPVPKTFPCMAGATNPGNIGHAWVKALWIDKKPAPGMEFPELYNPNDYDFIPARLEHNPVYANDVAYRKTLLALPSSLRKAFLEGDWSIFAGQYFDIFSASRHVRPSTLVEIKPWWPKWISMDWGFAHPASVHWHAQDGNKTITYREDYGSGIGEKEWGERIVEKSRGEKIEAFYLSPDAFAKRTSSNTIADIIGRVLRSAGMVPPVPADNNRVGGARLMYQVLFNDLWEISSDCKKLIECLPTLIHDPDNPEDVLKVDQAEGQIGDDPYDDCRYGLQTHLAGRKMPQEEADRQAALKIDDPFARHFFAVKRAAIREEAGKIREAEFLSPWEAENQ